MVDCWRGCPTYTGDLCTYLAGKLEAFYTWFHRGLCVLMTEDGHFIYTKYTTHSMHAHTHTCSTIHTQIHTHTGNVQNLSYQVQRIHFFGFCLLMC